MNRTKNRKKIKPMKKSEKNVKNLQKKKTEQKIEKKKKLNITEKKTDFFFRISEFFKGLPACELQCL